MNNLSESANRAIRQVIDRGSQVRTVMLYGPFSQDIELAAQELIKEWMSNESGLPNLDRIVDCQIVEPVGPSRMILIDAFQEPPPGKERKHTTIPLHSFFRTRPLMFPRKVAWLREAERITGRAANAGLKLLEELPEFGRVIMTTTNFNRVLPTIRSRCLCIACGSTIPERDSQSPESILIGHGIEDLDFARLEVVRDLAMALDSAEARAPNRALVISETVRTLASKWGDLNGIGARTAHAEIMEMIAKWVAFKNPEMPHLAQNASESYRAILGNGNSGLIFDSFFTDCATHVRELTQAR